MEDAFLFKESLVGPHLRNSSRYAMESVNAKKEENKQKRTPVMTGESDNLFFK